MIQKHIKIILFAHLICTISMAIVASFWYAFFENKNLITMLFIMLGYALFAWPVLLLIIMYHLGLGFLQKRKGILSRPRKLVLILLMGVLFYTCFFALPNIHAFSYGRFISIFLGVLLFSAFAFISYEYTLHLSRKWGWDNKHDESGR